MMVLSHILASHQNVMIEVKIQQNSQCNLNELFCLNFSWKLQKSLNFVSHRNFMMLVLSRKLASRRKRDDQGTIGQLPAAVALLS